MTSSDKEFLQQVSEYMKESEIKQNKLIDTLSQFMANVNSRLEKLELLHLSTAGEACNKEEILTSYGTQYKKFSTYESKIIAAGIGEYLSIKDDILYLSQTDENALVLKIEEYKYVMGENGRFVKSSRVVDDSSYKKIMSYLEKNKPAEGPDYSVALNVKFSNTAEGVSFTAECKVSNKYDATKNYGGGFSSSKPIVLNETRPYTFVKGSFPIVFTCSRNEVRPQINQASSYIVKTGQNSQQFQPGQFQPGQQGQPGQPNGQQFQQFQQGQQFQNAPQFLQSISVKNMEQKAPTTLPTYSSYF